MVNGSIDNINIRRCLIMNKIFKIIILMIFFVGFTLQVQSFAFQEIDYKKMDRDLKIMEKIIDTIISEQSDLELRFVSGKTKGVYLEGYGVLFMIPASSSFISLTIREPYLKRKGTEVTIVAEGKSKEINLTEELKKKLTDFLASYADAIKQVKDEDMITLFLNAPRKKSYRYTLYNLAGERVKRGNYLEPFVLSVKKDVLKRYRKGIIDFESFKNSVQFSSFSKKDEKYPEMTEDIKILKTILETALEEHYGTRITSESIQGTYLENFGVVFTADLNRLNVWSENKTLEEIIVTSRNRGRVIPALEKEKKKRYEKLRNELKDNLCEILADFGHTLRRLKNNEKVYIFISSSNGSFFREFKTDFMLVVKKDVINSYRNGLISLDEFKNRTVFKEF